jgi:hypothetical protein
LTHTFFKGAAQRAFPLTNVGANGNQFQVDEALLVEKIGFFIPSLPTVLLTVDLFQVTRR